MLSPRTGGRSNGGGILVIAKEKHANRHDHGVLRDYCGTDGVAAYDLLSVARFVSMFYDI